MKRRALVPLAAVAAVLLAAGPASAEEDPGARARYGMLLGGGVFIAPGVGTLVHAQVAVMFGVQFNNVLSLVFTSTSDATFVEPSRLQIAPALLLDLTFGGKITVGLGPEAGYYEAGLALRPNSLSPDAVGWLFGGRLHFAWHAIRWGPTPDSTFFAPPSSALTFGVDLRLLRGRTGLELMQDPNAMTSATTWVIFPTTNFGLEFF